MPEPCDETGEPRPGWHYPDDELVWCACAQDHRTECSCHPDGTQGMGHEPLQA